MLIALGVIIVVIIAVGLVITELALRVSYANDVYASATRHPPHPFLQVVTSGQTEHIDAAGFRGDGITVDRVPGTVRIFALGGSTTLGISNPYDASYPAILQALLRKRHPGVAIDVENAGATWYTTAHSLVNYQLRVRQFDPDIVVFFEAINDLVRSFSPPWWAKGDFQPDYSHYLGPYIRFTGPDVEFLDGPTSWLTWRIVKRWMLGEPSPYNQRDPDNVAKMAARMHPTDQPAFRSLPSFKRFYETLVEAVLADHHRLIMASQPFIYRTTLTADERRLLWFPPLLCADHGTYPSVEAMVRGMEAYNAAARDLAAAHHVPFLDFEAAVPKTPDYFSDDVHLRQAANAILAKTVADYIDSQKLIEAIIAGPVKK